jgi:excinuclease ABC subunit C
MKIEVKDFPRLPGVYLFKNDSNEIIYVGKARNLKDRVSSYFHNHDDQKVVELLGEYSEISYIVTKSEIDALLLEAQLIQDFQPKFNTLLKDGNPFLYIKFTDDSMEIVRMRTTKGRYFGPFMHKRDARSVFDYLERTFRLFRCNRTIEHGCLEYHLGKCSGSCKPDFSKASYMYDIQLAELALKGNHKKFLETIKEQILFCNQNRLYEKSKRLTEILTHFETVFETLKSKFSAQKYAQEIVKTTSPLKRPKDEFEKGLKELALLLQLPIIPETIDCFDISHFQSTHITGSCIRFTHGVPDKNKFRRFKIRSIREQNDYAALAEIVTRRYRQGDWPDIILIDGGKGQRSTIQSIFPSKIILSLAKREETLHTPLHPEGIKLDLKSPLGQLLIALRDYTHHFAISYHRLLRKKNIALQALES